MGCGSIVITDPDVLLAVENGVGVGEMRSLRVLEADI
jgi:hypothetical protein